ncbi:MAG TPA: precorrin-3B C(17)-methyltransferase [Candidatus Dormibacteraeota bacterium]|nr:precorrin-3B C(17)-methyltransferase [Candidatus Dormibacteraeota bacterium]
MSGRLAIVGLGPGSPDLLTTAAAAELASADLLIGYRRYLEWVPTRLAQGTREPYELGQERLRARRAVEAAVAGLHVALVSGGDPGVYGIAALALEEAAIAGHGLEVRVVPGVTAATAAAALVGAPLAVDFACLSLSDQLLPTEELEARTQALAAADIVLVLYNPAGQSRRAPWEMAVDHLQRRRPATTPVAAIRRAFRPGQEVHLSEVGHLHELPVDMETVVIVGSSRTRRLGDWLVTLRDWGRR